MKTTSKNFNKREILIFLLAFGIFLTVSSLWLFTGFSGLVSAPLLSFELHVKALFGEEVINNIWALLAAQLSLTFISISVLSILSDKDHVIYWKDLVEQRLLSPRFCCFAAYTYYSITAAIISCVAVLFTCTVLFLFAFALNLVVLILLTDSILDVYFSKEKHCKQMENELKEAYKKAFQVKYDERNDEHYNKIMDDFATQIQRHKEDALYMRQVFELIYNNIELFDTTNTSVQEVLYHQFGLNKGTIDLRPFKTVVEQAEKWTERVKNGEQDVIYTADWLFWTTAVDHWKETECFFGIHSHSISISHLIELEKLLERRLEALIQCEKKLAPEKTQKEFVLASQSNSKIIWVQDKYFYLLQALFGGYVALYAKRLNQYYNDKQVGKTPYDENVNKHFGEHQNALPQLVQVISEYNDIDTHLYKYSDEVKARFLSLIKKS